MHIAGGWMQDILNIGGEDSIYAEMQGESVSEFSTRLKYGTGMRINAALKVLAEKRRRRQQRKEEVYSFGVTVP